MCVARTVEFLGSQVTCLARDAPCHNHLGTSVQNIRALQKKKKNCSPGNVLHPPCFMHFNLSSIRLRLPVCFVSFYLFPSSFIRDNVFSPPLTKPSGQTLQSTHKTPSRNRRNAVNSKHASILAWCADTPDANSETRKARIRPATLPSPRLAANPDPRPFNHPTRLSTPP